MGRRRISRQPQDTPPLCRRFEWVLQNLFGNSISLMAAALEIPHASLSRVINHGQLPSAEMLLGVARDGRVNLDWLLGEVDAPSTSARSACTFLPVSDRLLPGPPSVSPESLPPLGLPTASPLLLCDAYWFRVPAGSLIVGGGDKDIKTDGRQIFPGDFLLIEAGPAWTARAAAFVGRLVVLRHPGQPEALFANVAEDEEYFDEIPGRQHKLNTFGIYPDASMFVESSRPASEPRKSGRRIQSVDEAFYIDDLIGVVLERRTLYGRMAD